jgi:hypothetical protein
MRRSPESTEHPEMTARLLNCSNAEYLRDPCAVPSLNATTAKVLLDRSPMHAWLQHPRLGNQPREPSKAQDEGQLIHTLLLGTGVDVEIINADNFRTKAAQQARDEAIEAGRLPVLADKYAAALAGVTQIKAHLAQFGIELDGASEYGVEWTEPGDYGDVVCRTRLDHVYHDKCLILEIKKADSAHPLAAARAVESYRYHLQMAAEVRAFQALQEGPIDFLLVFVECEPPYAVLPARLNGQYAEIGKNQWLAAVRIWERCLRENHWPGYAEEAVTLQPREWYAAQELGKLGDEDS